MNTKLVLKVLIFTVFMLLAFPETSVAAEAPKEGRPKIYDESLDGVKQINDAMVEARKGNKRILIQFGANWCGWCHKLHKLFESDKAISDELKADYVLILIDVDKGHNAGLVTKYGADHLGLPSLVVLDSEGEHLTTKNTSELEEGDHHNPPKVLAFLKEQAPKK
jgi:thiol:disulfide interchange protein